MSCIIQVTSALEFVAGIGMAPSTSGKRARECSHTSLVAVCKAEMYMPLLTVPVRDLLLSFYSKQAQQLVVPPNLLKSVIPAEKCSY